MAKLLTGITLLLRPFLPRGCGKTEPWAQGANPMDYGHLDARHGRKVVASFLDGSVRSLEVEEMRDMRLWSVKAAMKNDPNYKIRRARRGRL